MSDDTDPIFEKFLAVLLKNGAARSEVELRELLLVTYTAILGPEMASILVDERVAYVRARGLTPWALAAN